jgi:hypothetical protein
MEAPQQEEMSPAFRGNDMLPLEETVKRKNAVNSGGSIFNGKT